MAEIGFTVTLTEELRPAIGIYDGSKLLVHTARQSARHGLFVCEKEDGTMVEYDEECIRFLDSREKFDELAWGE